MTLKSTITAILVICASLFAETVTPVAVPDSAKGNTAVSAGANSSAPETDAEDDSDDDDVSEAPSDVDFEMSSTPLLKGKTGIPAIDTLPVNEWDIPTKRNSLKYAMLGLLIYDVFFNRSYQRERLLDRARPFQDSVLYFTTKVLEARRNNAPLDSITEYQSKRQEFLERVRAQSDKKMEQEDVRKAEVALTLVANRRGRLGAPSTSAAKGSAYVDARAGDYSKAFSRAFVAALNDALKDL